MVKVSIIPKTKSSSSSSGGTTNVVTGNVGAFDDIVSTHAKIDKIDSTEINSTNINTENVKSNKVESAIVNTDGLVTNTENAKSITTEYISSTDVEADNIYTKKIKSNNAELDYATITQLIGDTANFKNLTVSGKAHFFELVIDKIKAAGGSIILTPCDGFNVDNYIKDSTNNVIGLFWQSNQNGSARYNMWQPNDQAICQSFNNATVGTSMNISNKMWWSKVTEVSGSSPMYGCEYNSKFYSDTESCGSSVKDSLYTFKYSELYDFESKGMWTLAQYDIYLTKLPVGSNETPETVDKTKYKDTKYGYYTYTAATISEYKAFNDSIKGLYECCTSTAYYRKTEFGEFIWTKEDNYKKMKDFNRLDCKIYNWITISTSACYDGSNFDTIEKGDSICMLGYEGTDDDNRQSAIYISAYKSLDSGLTAPLIAQYKGINDFSLSTHRSSYFDATSAEFIGSFKVVSNGTQTDLDKYITDKSGSAGTKIKSQEVVYQLSTNGTTVPTGTWSTSIPTTTQGDYLWCRTTITYSDNTEPTVTYSVSRMGLDGTSVSIKSTSVTYAITTTSTKPSDSSFTYTSIPTLSQGEYLWTRTEIIYSDDTSVVNYGEYRIGSDGTDGQQGPVGPDGKTSYTHFAYSTSADGSANFSTTSFSGATYIGILTDFTEADSTDYKKYTWSLFKGSDGKDGTDGSNGKGISSHYTYWLATSSSSGVTKSTSGWSTTAQSVTSTLKYLWSYEVITYTDGVTETISPHIIGTYGDKGDTGTNGTNGTSITISSTSITYQTSTSGTTTPTGTWSTTVPTVSNGNYLWTKTVVTYSNAISTTSYSVSRYGTNGADGSSITVTSTSVTYSVTTTSTQPADSTFTSTTVPTVAIGNYLWSKTTVTYSDGKSTTSYSVSRIGSDGSNGTNGTNGTDGKTSYFHIAYANSSDGSSGFSTTYFSGALYIGTYTDFTESDSTTYSDYTWARLKGQDGTNGRDGADGADGANGADADFYKLIDNGSYSTVSSEKLLTVKLNYKLVHITGNTSTTMSSCPSAVTFRWSFINDDLSYVGWNYVTFSSSLFSYSNTYANTTDKNNIAVQLLYNSATVDSIIIPVNFTASASFSVTDTINSTVTNNYKTLNDKVTTNTNNISTIDQKADRIQSTVTSHTTSIDTLNGDMANKASTSQLTQTAENIEAKVNATGVNITNGTITLDADKTIVKGKLQINEKEDGTGLLITDSNGIPRIDLRCDTMSDMTNMVNGNSSSLGGSVAVSVSCGAEINSTTLSANSYTILGTYSSGETLSISDLRIAGYNITDGNFRTYYTVKIQTTSDTTLKTYSGSFSGASSISLGSYSTSISTAGSYRIYVEITYTCASSDLNTHPYTLVTCANTRTPTNEVIIGSDGLAVSCGTNKWLYVGKNEIEIKWGTSEGIKISDTGLQEYYASGSTGVWSAFGKRHIKYLNGGTWTLDSVTDFILFSGSSACYLSVGTDQAIDGRCITVADKADANGYIRFLKGNLVLSGDKYNASQVWTSFQELNGNCMRRYTYSADANCWFEEFMS